MNSLLLHPTSAKQLELFTNDSPQSILLSGQTGVGLATIASEVAKKIGGNSSQVLTISPDEKGIIKIETIRGLYKQTRAKQKSPLVIVLDNGDAMQPAAQNAFLKLLEEPPRNIVFILTSHSPQLLLPTVRSRIQEQNILPTTTAQTDIQLETMNITDKVKKAQMNYIASGLPAEIFRLAEDKEYFEKRSNEVKQARDFLSANTYQKLVMSYRLGSDREQTLLLIKDASQILKKTMIEKPTKNLTGLLKKLLLTEEKLENDGHVRTQLLRLIIG